MRIFPFRVQTEDNKSPLTFQQNECVGGANSDNRNSDFDGSNDISGSHYPLILLSKSNFLHENLDEQGLEFDECPIPENDMEQSLPNFGSTTKDCVFLIYMQSVGGHNQTGICAALSVNDCLGDTLKRHEELIYLNGREKDVNGSNLGSHIAGTSSSASSHIEVDGHNGSKCSYCDGSPERLYKSTGSLDSLNSGCSAKDMLYGDPIMVAYRQRQDIDNLVSHIIDSSTPIIDIQCGSEIEYHKVWLVSDCDDVLMMRQHFEKIETLYIADGHHRAHAATLMAKAMTHGPGSSGSFTSTSCTYSIPPIPTSHPPMNPLSLSSRFATTSNSLPESSQHIHREMYLMAILFPHDQLAFTSNCNAVKNMSELITMADSGILLPAKSTCFKPKPLKGLFVRVD